MFIKNIDKHSSVETIGGVLYTGHFIFLLVAGILLLLAMVGAIFLSMEDLNKKETVSRQISRRSSKAFFCFSGVLVPKLYYSNLEKKK